MAIEDTAVTAGVEHASSEICSICHSELYVDFLKSDHLWKPAKEVEGQSPAHPFTEVTSPPEGFGWDNIAYVIGGHNWKARFIDQNGYIITSDADATTSTALPTR
jgi:hypothetical protein